MSEQTTAPTERDELADLIETAVEDPIYNAGDVPPSLTPMVANAAADAILTAGYRKPRTVTTVEELDKLPVGSVVLSFGKSFRGGFRISFQRWDDGTWHRGARSGDTHPDNFLPATVLHEGASA